MEEALQALTAAIGGVISTTCLFPVEVIKTTLQAGGGGGRSQSNRIRDEKRKNRKGRLKADDEQMVQTEEEVEQEGGVGGGGLDHKEEEENEKESRKKPTFENDGVDLENVEDKDVGDVEEAKEGEGEDDEEEEEEMNSSYDVAKMVWKRKGLKGFFHGVEYSALESALEKAAYFYGYSWLKRLALYLMGHSSGGAGRRGGGLTLGTPSISPGLDLLLGYLAEASHLPVTLPIQVVVTRMITSGMNTTTTTPTTTTASKELKPSKGDVSSGDAGIYGVMQAILSQGGVGGFYKGIKAYVVLCLKPAIQYAIFNRLKAAALLARAAREQATATARGGGGGGGGASRGGNGQLTALQAFMLGALARAIATVLAFPCIRAKVLMMSRPSPATQLSSSSSSIKQAPPRPLPSNSMMSSIIQMAKEDGVSALFRGMTPELVRGVLSAALMLMVKERVYAVIVAALRGHRLKAQHA